MTEQQRDAASQAAIEAHNAEERRKAVARLWRLEQTDREIARSLHLRRDVVKAIRKELGLPANKRRADR